MKTAAIDYFFVFDIRCLFSFRKRITPLSLAGLIRIDLLLSEVLLREELCIASEQNVGSAARHVGCNGDLALAARLSNYVGFARSVLGFGVQNVVRNVGLLQSSGERF